MVEHRLAKARVASSNLVFRSINFLANKIVHIQGRFYYLMGLIKVRSFSLTSYTMTFTLISDQLFIHLAKKKEG